MSDFRKVYVTQGESIQECFLNFDHVTTVFTLYGQLTTRLFFSTGKSIWVEGVAEDILGIGDDDEK